MEKIKLKELSAFKKLKLKSSLAKIFGKDVLKAFSLLEEGTSKDELKNVLGDKTEEFVEHLRKEGVLEEEKVKEETKSEEGKPSGEEVEIKPIPIEEAGEPEGETEESEELVKSEEELETSEIGGGVIKPITMEELEGPSEKETKEEETKIEEGEETVEKEAEEEEELSEDEQIVNEIFGMDGVKVYRMVLEGKSKEEIAEELSLDEEEIDTILEFLKSRGMIEAEVEQEEEEKFAPLESKEIEEVQPISKEDGVWYVEKTEKANILLMARVKLSVVMKFGKDGKEILEEIDKGVTELELVEKLKIPLDRVEKILKFLEDEKFIKMQILDRKGLRKKFGYDIYNIWKKYGKKGALFYILLGKDTDLKKIKELIGEKDVEKFVEMFLFIREMLGIRVPVDKEILIKKLS